MSIYSVIEKIKVMRQANDPNSPEIKKALTQIGGVLQGRMRDNIIRMKAVDGSYLLNSIQYNLDENILSVGSYGIPYAARNEYGGPMSHRQVAAMFYYMRKAGKFSKVEKAEKNRGKPVVTVNPDGSGQWRARPFIGNALRDKRKFIIRVIKEAANP